jgi:hypothetical protein
MKCISQLKMTVYKRRQFCSCILNINGGGDICISDYMIFITFSSIIISEYATYSFLLKELLFCIEVCVSAENGCT